MYLACGCFFFGSERKAFDQFAFSVEKLTGQGGVCHNKTAVCCAGGAGRAVLSGGEKETR